MGVTPLTAIYASLPTRDEDCLQLFPHQQRSQEFHVLPAKIKYEYDDGKWWLVAQFANGWEEKLLRLASGMHFNVFFYVPTTAYSGPNTYLVVDHPPI